MTGRGRPRKERSPETKGAKSKTRPEEIKQVPLPRCPEKDLTEVKQNGTTKEQKPKEREQKKPNHTDEKPSVQSMQKEKTTKHLTEDTTKQKRSPVRGAKAKTYAGKAKSTDESIEEMPKSQPETPKDTDKDPVKNIKAKARAGKSKSPEKFTEETINMQPGAKAKTCAGRAKSTDKSAEEMPKSQPETPKDTDKDSMNNTKAKARAGKTKSPEKFTEETTEMQPETPENTTKACKPQHRGQDKATVDSVLSTTLEKLKIKRNDRAIAAELVNTIIESIIRHLKQNTQYFKEVEPLRTGSYYENVKISNPDEFDIMLSVPVDRVDIKPFGDDGAFYSVALKRGMSPLKKFQESSTLSASEMLEEFRKEVKKCVRAFPEWTLTRKKKGCPAVTLTRNTNTNGQSVTISLDVVLCLMVKSSWPCFTKEGFKVQGWLGTKVKQDYKRKPYYLVPKYEGKGAVEIDGVFAKDVWRVSFSHVEKDILRNHGSEKTCCEKDGERCCRKDCLKLLKHLLSRLKEQDSSFEKFCSYYAKTTLLHACCSRAKDRDWHASSLSQCFQQLLDDFVGHLEEGVLPNFFIPDQNLLSGTDQRKCNNLAQRIKEERDNSFPIFK